MPKIAKPLSALGVKNLTKPGMHLVGTVPGLSLNIKASGARSWVLKTMVGSRRSEIGLGGYPGVTLAMAIEAARETIRQIKSGVDPVAKRREIRSTVEWTFQRCCEAYIAAYRPGWKNAKHVQQWENTLATYVYPICGAKHVRDISKADVLAVIEPDWSTKNETMVRVRNRMELVLAWAMTKGHRPEELNPARWKGHLDAALPKPSKVNNREHFEAVPIDGMFAFMSKLRAVDGVSARALEFAILTASRTGSVRQATWDQIDVDAAVWIIPASAMKSGRPHRVPLSEPALELLESLTKTDGVDLVFPGRGGKTALSDMSLTQTMRRMNLTAVPHGFRSTFSDWCAERTGTPAEVREMALAHVVGDKTEEAYRRGDLFAKRVELMAQWAHFISTPPPKGNVRAIRGSKAAAAGK